MSRGVSTFLKISRLTNNLKDKAKSEGKSYSLEESEDLTIVEGKYIYCFLESNGPIWIDLIAFSISTFSNSSILERSRDIVYIIFLNYIFF